MAGVVASRHDVARLLGRAAFGASPADLDALEGAPYAAVVDRLLNVPPMSQRLPAADEWRRLGLEHGFRTAQATSRGFVEQAQRWWLQRMRTTPYPLEEKMVMFWHDHFATAYRNPYPDVSMLVAQNETLRRHALGDFRELCSAMTRDPAMLYWLDGVLNVRGRPNENYAREFFELFTLGTLPQVYTEDDVREAARVFTGWNVELLSRTSRFDRNRHDPADKRVLGATIRDEGDREHRVLLDHALAHEVAPLFLAYKLVVHFAYIPVTGDLVADPDPLVTKVAAALRQSNWSIAVAVRELLLADEFRDADVAAGRQVVRQPVDLVVSACRAIGISADTTQAISLLERMGQRPFDPPNVGGWPLGKEWLSPVTTLARYDWGVACHDLWRTASPYSRATLPAAGDLHNWARLFGLAGFSDNTRDAIHAYLSSRASAPEAERQAGVLILVASSPDWMVM